MSAQTIVIIVAVIAVVMVLVSRRAGPRVTQINRSVRRDKDEAE